jgi:hypothetical protein
MYVDEAEGQRATWLRRLLEVWADANARWYASVLTQPVVLLTPPSGVRVYGDTATVGSYGEPTEIRIRPSLLEGTHPHMVHGSGDPEGLFLFAADVLLHEQIHQWQMDILKEAELSYHGHGPKFTDQANAIGHDLGLPAVVTRNRKGSKHPLASEWPHNVRPPDYYRGADCPSPSEGTQEGGEPEEPREPGVLCPMCGGNGRLYPEEETT